jgi:hypothetical protein
MSIQYINTTTHSLSDKQKKFLFILEAWLYMDTPINDKQEILDKINTITTYNVYRESDKEWLNKLRDLWVSDKTKYPPFDDAILKYKTINN